MKIIYDRKGEIGIWVFVLIFFVMAISMVVIEYMRVYSLRDSLEYQLQRGINVALEDAVIDSYRSDGLKGANETTKLYFYDYLQNDMNLSSDGSTFKLTKSEGDIYTLKVQQLTYAGETNDYELNLDASVTIKTIFGTLLGKDIIVPINVKSRNNIINNMPEPEFDGGEDINYE